MKITVVGYGKMGKEVEKILLERGHAIENFIEDKKSLEKVKNSETICIDFTTPSAFKENYSLISENFKGAVVGTTGWYGTLNDVKKAFESRGKKLVYGTNFSVGVNILFEIAGISSELIGKAKGYDAYIHELHHQEKKDAPSGTAVSLKEIIQENIKQEIPVSSVRSGFIKGIHEIGFESEVDKILIRHEAYSRAGFALGAVLAAEWLEGVNGIWNFRDLFKIKFKEIKNG